QRVLADAQHNVQVSRGSAILAGFSLSTELEAGTRFDPGRNTHTQRLRLTHHARPPAPAAPGTHGGAPALALTTGLGDAEQPLLVPDLPRAATGTASRTRASVLGAFATTGGTHRHTRDFDGLFRSEHRFFERDLQVVAQILAAPCARATAAS